MTKKKSSPAFGKRFIEACRKRNHYWKDDGTLIASVVAKEVGFERQNVAAWQDGDVDPNGLKAGHVVMFCHKTGVRPRWLVTGEGARDVDAKEEMPPIVQVWERLDETVRESYLVLMAAHLTASPKFKGILGKLLKKNPGLENDPNYKQLMQSIEDDMAQISAAQQGGGTTP